VHIKNEPSYHVSEPKKKKVVTSLDLEGVKAQEAHYAYIHTTRLLSLSLYCSFFLKVL